MIDTSMTDQPLRVAADLQEQVVDNLLYGDGYWFEVERDGEGRAVDVVPLVPAREAQA